MLPIVLRAGLLAIALTWTTIGLAQTLTRADRPNGKAGDSSVYRELNVLTNAARDTTFAVVTVDADRIVSQMTGDAPGVRTFTRDFNPMETRAADTVISAFRPFWPYLQFPLEVGRQWDLPFESDILTQYGNRHAKWRWQARVTGTEAVTVPAGTFQAFKIEYVGNFGSVLGSEAWTGSRKETAWYAPGANRIVKREFRQSIPSRNMVEIHRIELVSFRLGR